MRPVPWWLVEGKPEWWWGNVTSTNPLAVAKDNSTVGVHMADNTAGELEVGDRVLVQVNGTVPSVVGRKGGPRVGQWATWTPEWTTTGTTMTWGNSTRVGRYVHREDGTVSFTAKTVIGSTGFNPGTGHWEMLLPVPARVAEGQEYYVGLYVVGYDVVGGIGEAHGYGKIESGLKVDRSFFRLSNASATNYARINGTAGWAANNKIVVTGTYEAAP